MNWVGTPDGNPLSCLDRDRKSKSGFETCEIIRTGPCVCQRRARTASLTPPTKFWILPAS